GRALAGVSVGCAGYHTAPAHDREGPDWSATHVKDKDDNPSGFCLTGRPTQAISALFLHGLPGADQSEDSMVEAFPTPDVVRCYFDQSFEPHLPAMCLRWGAGGLSLGRPWRLPEGVTVSGPAPSCF